MAGSVVSTAGSSTGTDIVLPEPIIESLTTLGGSGSGVEWVSVEPASDPANRAVVTFTTAG